MDPCMNHAPRMIHSIHGRGAVRYVAGESKKSNTAVVLVHAQQPYCNLNLAVSGERETQTSGRLHPWGAPINA